MAMSAPVRSSLQLCGLLTLAALLLAALQFYAQPHIAANESRVAARTLLRILPAGNYDAAQPQDFVDVADTAQLGLRVPAKIYIARQRGLAVAVVLPATARGGYGGDIDLLVGIRQDGNITGVEILAHHETPGLGDRIEPNKSHWLENFFGKSLRNPPPKQWRVQPDGGVFDAFTGATITPRAVTNTVRNTLEYFAAHREQLLQPLVENSHE
jgi:Na+-translocating ferredoxin:NAD+ oxidoreductase subunit G